MVHVAFVFPLVLVVLKGMFMRKSNSLCTYIRKTYTRYLGVFFWYRQDQKGID